MRWVVRSGGQGAGGRESSAPRRSARGAAREERLPKAIDKDLWVKIIDQAGKNPDGTARTQPLLAARDRAIAALLFGSGIRSIELVRLNIGSVNLEKRQVHVLVGKRRKERKIGLSRRGAALVEEYLDLRATAEQNEPLFVSRSSARQGTGADGGDLNRRLTTKAVRDLVDRIETALGMKLDGPRRRGQPDGPVHPHAFRHSHATEAVRVAKKRGKSIFEVAEQLGHKDLATTRLYFKLVPDELIELVEDL